MKRLLLPAISVLVLASGTHAYGQKSADTLRSAVTEPFVSLSPYVYPATEAGFVSYTVFQNALAFDERNSKFVPIVAKAWKRIDDKTLEFELYDDLKFHNGNPLTADDLVESVKFAIDPAYKFRFKENHDWIDTVEKTGSHSLRVHARNFNATDLMHFAFRAHIFDSKVMATLEDKSEYGRRVAVGSGPYKVTNFDRNAGVSLERADTFKKSDYERAPIKNLRIHFVPDRQTQMAQLLTKNIDLMFNVSPDDAKELATQPDLRVTTIDSLTVLYVLIDSIGRSGKKELSDPRVRKAMLMAIDREALIGAVVSGGDKATRLNVLCFDVMNGCGHSTKPPAQDLEGAKKLLAEAGLPNGFDVTLDAQLRSRNVAEAISGMLRRINIRAAINPMETGVMFKRWQDGEVQVLVNNAPAGNWPDASFILGINYGSAQRDVVRDPAILKAIDDGETTHDQAKRAEIYKVAFDRMNELHSHYPISSMPVAWGHSKEIRFDRNPTSNTRTLLSDIVWD
jgi:peptide/nickel transport system substrate-binding protein